MSETFARVKLTSIQLKLWSEVRTATLWSQPAFADLWYSMMVDGDGEQAHFTNDKNCPIAATNGKAMFINPETYFSDKYNLGNRVFINCHEIAHAMFDHCTIIHNAAKSGKISYPDGKSLDYDDATMQRALDMLINDMLIKAKVGETPSDATHDPSLVDENDSALDAYRKVYVDKQKNQNSNQAPGPGQDFDKHLAPGQGQGVEPETAKSGRSDAEWKQAIAAALEGAQAQGKLPAGLERLLGKVMEPEIDWQDKLRTALTRRLGNSGASWNHLDDALVIRGIGAPGRIAYGAGRIIVAMDTSGSMTQATMDKATGETAGVIDDVRPRELIFIQCDAAIQEVMECDDSDALKRMKIRGLGGTDFRPVFDWIEQDGQEPDALIYFTDTYGTFPEHAPSYPVIWVSLVKDTSVPWGDYILAPIKYDE